MKNELVVETRIDTSGINKGTKEIESAIKSLEDRIGQSLSDEEKEVVADIYQDVIDKFGSIDDFVNNFVDNMPELNIEMHDNAGNLISKYEYLSQVSEQLGRELLGIEEEVYSEIYDKISKTENRFNKLFQSATKGADDLGKGLKRTVRNVARMGLALFGIRGAMNMIRSAMNTISSQDEQLKADIDYMRNALAYTLEPVVRKIIDWVKQLMFYIAYIIKMWTGKNIFENANKSLQKADKSAKGLQKTLAGFDEMNILNDNGSVGVAGAMPDFDLSALEGIKIPGWIDWIAKNKDLVLGFIQALIVGITALKFGLDGIFMLGIGVAILGVIELIKDLITFIKDPSWNNFVAILQDLSNVIVGVGLAMIGWEATNPVGWILLATGVITNFIFKLAEEKDATERLTEAKNRLNSAEKEFVNAQTTYVDALKRRDEALANLRASEEKTKESGEQLYNLVIFGKKTYDDLTDSQKETYLEYLKYKGALDDVESATQTLQQKEKDHIIELVNMKAETAKADGNFKDLGKTINELVKNGKLDIKDAKKILEDTYSSLDKNGRKTFKEQLPSYIDKSTQATKDLLRELAKIENQYDAIYRASGRAHSASSSSYKAKGGIAYAKGGIVPSIKLASGAIINRPGAGVPIGGERAPEGVIPLTDSQQMMLLGKAIGEYITINAHIVNSMNGRVISKELQKINAENDFAYNR